MLKLNEAVRRPVALRLNCTLKVVFPPAATLLAGCTVIVKSAAFVPDFVTVPTVNAAEPVFWIV